MARWIPKFIFKKLSRFLHLKDINRIIFTNQHETPNRFVEKTIEDFEAIIVSHNIERIPKEGRIIIASNHPLGGMDGLAILQEVSKIRPDAIFPVNDVLCYIPPLEPLFIPINKTGSNAENIKILNDAFASDKTILYFPAGLCSRLNDSGEIRDLEWKKTVISRAVKYKREIIPTFTEGKNSKRFYKLARFRTKIRLKANIEMLYLPDEMFKQKGVTTNIYFGKPIPYTVFDKSRKPVEWAALLREYVYIMKEQDITFVEFIKSH